LTLKATGCELGFETCSERFTSCVRGPARKG
jgi:hypothetical protein